MHLVYYLTKARLCLPRRGETALRVVDLYPPACKPYPPACKPYGLEAGLEAGSETARDYVIAGIVKGAGPSPKKEKKLSFKIRW